MSRTSVLCAVGWVLGVGCSGPGGEVCVTDASFPVASTSDAGLITVPLMACAPKAYAARASIGTGGQSFLLVLDTGSAMLAVAGDGCGTCRADGVTALYRPGASATDEDAGVSAAYGALVATGWSGELIADQVSVGSPPATAQTRLVAITQENGFFGGVCGPNGTRPQGVLGLQPGKAAPQGTNSFLDQFAATGEVPYVFATLLCPSGGLLWLGGYDATFARAEPHYTPMFPPGYDAYVYSVDLESIEVAGVTIPIPTGPYTAAMLDTGSDITSLPPAAFQALSAAVSASPGFQQALGPAASSFFSSRDRCLALQQSKEALDAALPPLTLHFGSNPSIAVTASATESYLKSTGCGLWCPGVTSRAPSPDFQSMAAILGAPMLASNVVVFDRANHRVGFAPHTPCP